jgi:hypothetical protein
MSKNYRSILTFLALVLLIIGVGCTTENQLVNAQSLTVETAQADDDPETGESDDEDCYCEDFEEVEPPAELIPAYQPAGYELDGAYSFEVDEFEEDAIWFVPGKGTATSIEFYGTGDEDFFEIIVSESPYASLEEWLAEVSNIEFEDDFEDEAEEYSMEEDIVTIKGVSVLLEDWTDEYGLFSGATFIHAGQFIVVEGTVSTEEMTKIIESLPVIP